MAQIHRHPNLQVELTLSAFVKQPGMGEAFGLTFQQVQKSEKGTNRIKRVGSCASFRAPSGYATATLAPSKGRLMRCTVDGLTPNRSAMTRMLGRPGVARASRIVSPAQGQWGADQDTSPRSWPSQQAERRAHRQPCPLVRVCSRRASPAGWALLVRQPGSQTAEVDSALSTTLRLRRDFVTAFLFAFLAALSIAKYSRFLPFLISAIAPNPLPPHASPPALPGS